MASRKPSATQVELDVFLGAAEHAVGKLVYVRAGQREFSQFAYRETWLSDPRFFDVSPDLDKPVGYQVRHAVTKEDSVFFFALADTEPDSWGQRVIARAHAKERQKNPALGPLTELEAESSLKCNVCGRERVPLGEFGLDDFGIDLARRAEVEDLAGPVKYSCPIGSTC